LEPLVEAADRLYNSRVFAGDHSDEPYREYYVAVRRNDDAARLRANPPFQAGADAEATALLSGLAKGLRALGLRAHNAEREWESTARMLDAYIADLAVAKREWGATAHYAQQLQAAKDESDAGWLARDAESQAALQRAREELHGLGQAVAQREERLVQAEQRLQQEHEQQEQARRRLEGQRADDAAAYARSRRKWKLAMLALGVGGLLAGYAAGWVTL
jgi:chromosome segregation ATPase